METDHLEGMESRFQNLEIQLSDPSVIADQTAWRALAKEHAGLEETVAAYRAYKAVRAAFDEDLAILEDPAQEELHELAKEDLRKRETELEELDRKLHILLLPKDPNDEKNVILEIRAGTGGEEAALFVGDLLRMYLKFAEKKGWTAEITDASETEIGGFKEVTCIIQGKNAYSLLKFESGVHRVQRVPDTETAGRIHTSAVTVAILPEADDVDVDVNRDDLRIDVYRSSGAGGQHINKTSSAVRITHIPTGMVVTCQNERSQQQNREKALQILKSRLYAEAMDETRAKTAADRKEQVGSGDRSERIRTYNFPQRRVTDHRTKQTLYKLEEFMNGDLDEILKGLIEVDMAERLKEVKGHGGN